MKLQRKLPAWRRRRQSRERSRSMGASVYLFVRLISLMTLLAVALWGWSWLTNPNTFPIKKVIVEAKFQHVSKSVLEKIAAPYVTQGFFDVDLAALKKRLLQLPWVSKVTIRRVWPSKLVIKVTPQIAFAYWGEKALLNPQGKVFSPSLDSFPKNLPRLFGPQDMSADVLQHYQKVTALLAPLNLTVTQFTLSARGSWKMVLSNGVMVLIGRIDFVPRIQRFVAVYPKVFADSAKTAKTIDLRYPNGFAVDWKNG